MRAFAQVVRKGSISAAAQQLGVSQSAISQHISKVETLVGSKLLIRGRDGVTLTTIGQEIFSLADEFAALDQQIAERLHQHSELDLGHISIIANAPQPALRLIARFTRRFPKISVNFGLCDWSSAVEQLHSHRVDIAFITDPPQQTDLFIKEIIRSRYVAYARADHPIATLQSSRLADLVEHTLVLPEKGSLTQRVVKQALKKANLTLQRSVTMTTFPVMKEAVLQGVGVGIFLQHSSVAAKDLCEIPIADMPEEFSTCLVVPKHKLGLRVTQSFLEALD
ncbi:LysR family transcriptional regulator [Tritonibacter multivorans]|nr:LysR family transcriptional regulator [Tritonibacter multivorans]